MFSRFMARRSSRSMMACTRSARKYSVKSASMRPSFLSRTGAISCTVLICSKRFSIMGWPLWASSTWAGDRLRSLVMSGYMPSLFVVKGDGFLVDRPFDVEASFCDFAIRSIGARSTPPRLLEDVVLAHGALDLEVARDVMPREDGLDMKIDIGRAPQSRPWSGEPLT